MLICQNSCASTSGGGSISYWSTSARTCKCSQTYPTTTDYSFGVPGTCPSNTNELYRMQTTFTAYQNYYCRATSDLTLTYSASGSNINACFQQCKSFTYAIWVPVSFHTTSYHRTCTDKSRGAPMFSSALAPTTLPQAV